MGDCLSILSFRIGFILIPKKGIEEHIELSFSSMTYELDAILIFPLLLSKLLVLASKNLSEPLLQTVIRSWRYLVGFCAPHSVR